MWIMMLWTIVIGDSPMERALESDKYLLVYSFSGSRAQPFSFLAPCAAFLLRAYISKLLAQ